MTETAVAVKNDNTALALGGFEDFLLEDVGAGTETIGNDDRSVPYLGIAEALSGVMKKSNEKYNPAAKVGDIVNNVTGQIYPGEDGVEIVLVSYSTRYTEWYPHGSPAGKGMVKDFGADASALDGTFVENKKNMTPRGTEIVKSGDYVVFVLDRATGSFAPAVVSMAKSRFGSARRLNAMLQDERIMVKGKSIKPPIYYGLWKLSTKGKTGDGNEWNVFETSRVGNISDLPNGAEVYQAAREFRGKLESGLVVVGTNPDLQQASVDDDQDIPF